MSSHATIQKKLTQGWTYDVPMMEVNNPRFVRKRNIRSLVQNVKWNRPIVYVSHTIATWQAYVWLVTYALVDL